MGYVGKKFKVCPVQGRQLKDVRNEDIFRDFRICNTYRGGGGYDQFPVIAERRGLVSPLLKGHIEKQFVVQLQGCHLRCPYCYVTRDGIYGDTVKYYAGELLEALHEAYNRYDVGVFHMMGGAPALHMSQWPSVLQHLFPHFMFHSDLLLTEGYYDRNTLHSINQEHCLYAIGVKGVRNEDYERNTGCKMNWPMFWHNLELVIDSGINFYLTFTNCDLSYLQDFKEEIAAMHGPEILEDSFEIDLKQYDALADGPAW
jgi:pyruvate-formate lyase-activating enzyme